MGAVAERPARMTLPEIAGGKDVAVSEPVLKSMSSEDEGSSGDQMVAGRGVEPRLSGYEPDQTNRALPPAYCRWPGATPARQGRIRTDSFMCHSRRYASPTAFGNRADTPGSCGPRSSACTSASVLQRHRGCYATRAAVATGEQCSSVHMNLRTRIQEPQPPIQAPADGAPFPKRRGIPQGTQFSGGGAPVCGKRGLSLEIARFFKAENSALGCK